MSRSGFVRRAAVGVSTCLALLAAPPRLPAAQIGTAAGVTGIARDASGAVLPGVGITAVNLATAVQQATVTDDSGRYRLPSLSPGLYRVEATLQGFQPQVRERVELTVARTLEIDFTLGLGQLAETVTVEAAAGLVETANGTVSALVSGQEVRSLPLNGRSFDQLISLSPGTVYMSNRSPSAARGTGNQFGIGGTRPGSIKFIIDGAELAGGGGLNTAVNTASGNMLGVEAVQEFAVVTNNGDASYGKKPGGQINIVTRSGTNQLHGSAFEFVRNDAFDARNFFDVAKAPLRQNNYGFAVGGPVRRDRTFFFVNLEQYKERRGVTLRPVVPTMAVRQGIFPDGTVLAVNPAVVGILALYPVPTGRDFGDGTAEAVNPATRTVDDTYVVSRVDHTLWRGGSLFGRYLIQTGERREPNDNNLGQFLEADPSRTQLLTIGFKQIFTSRLVNQATASYNRGQVSTDFVPRDGLDVPPEMILVPGQTAHGGIGVGVQGSAAGQLPNLGGSGTLGTAGRFVDRQVFHYADQVSYSRGAHFLQTGFELQTIESEEFGGTQARGFLQFPSLQALVQGRPNQLRGPLVGSDAVRDWHQTYGGVYAQDSWKVRANLTLNLGLRWERIGNPTEANGKTAALVPAGGDPANPYPNTPTVTPAAFATLKSSNWAPRTGLAWDVFGNGRTAIRGGFGLFYQQIESEFRRTLGASAPFWNSVVVTNPPFPNPGAALCCAAAGRLSPLGIQQDPDTPTSVQYQMRLEQAVGPKTVVSVGYTGSHGYHLVRHANPQIPPPVATADGRLAIPQRLMNPALSATADYLTYDATSAYDALQLEADQRLSHGLRLKAAFTWGKVVDDGVEPNSQPFGFDDGTLVATDHRSSRGLAPFDVRRRLVVNWSHDVPASGHAGVLAWLADDWQLSGIFQMQDGFPFTALTGVSRSFPVGQNTADRPDLAPGASANPVLGGPQRYFDASAFVLQPSGVLGNVGAGTIIGPGLVNLDLSVVKVVSMGARFRTELRIDGFNVLNRANFGIPDNILFQTNGQPRPAAGRITTTATTAREFQLAAKFVF